MIIDNLYPDFYGVYMGDTSNQYRAQMTAAFSRTYDGGVIESADNYFLGYIGKDKLPASMQMSVMYFDGDGNLVAEDITDESNFPCGYCWINTTSETARNIYTIENGVKTFGQYATSAQLMNQNYPMYSGRSHRSTPALSITGFFIIYSPDGTRIFPTASNADTPSWGINIQYVSDALKFLKGETDYTITLSNSGYKVTINAETIKTGNEYLQCDDADVFVRLIICNFGTTNGGQCKNGGSYNTFYPGFMAKATGHYNDKTYELLTYGVSMPGLYITSGYGLIQDRPTEDNPFFAYIETHGTITAEQLADAQSSTGRWLSWANDGNLAVVRQLASGAGHFAFPVRIMTIDEIARAFYLMYRGDTTVNGITSGYVRNVTYATDVTPQNEFLARWKTGNLSDDNFKNSLRPWQYEDFQEGDFTEDDIPPYEPEPEPGEGDDPDEEPETDDPVNGPDKEDRGDKLPGLSGTEYPAHTSPFVKYGVFSYNDLMNLSLQLWDKPVGWFEAVAAAQKVNPMDFFISLRWYPTSLVSSDAQLYPEIFLGKGGKLYVNHKEAASTVFTIDFGTVNVKEHYHNFLDYDPYTKIYLFLPFCGQIELNSTVVMGKTLSLKCAIDVTDGSIVYQVYNETDKQPIFTKQARIGCEIPITALDASQMGSNIVNASLGTLNTVMNTGATIFEGAKNGALAGGMLGPETAAAGALVGGATGLLSNTTNLISSFTNLSMASKDIVQLTGGTSGLAASLTDRVAYIIYQRPLATNPDTYGHTVGFVHNKAASIKDVSGFTICKNVDVNDIEHATSKEKAEIKRILDSGFYA